MAQAGVRAGLQQHLLHRSASGEHPGGTTGNIETTLAKAMNRRLLLTLIWIAFLGLAVFSVEMYYWAYPTLRKLIPEERVPAYKPLLAVYGIHLVAILGAWFKKPFPRLQFDHNDNARFAIAVVVTILFNLLVLYFLSLAHWQDEPALPTIKTAMTLATIFSVLVGPINWYYFGVKVEGGTKAGSTETS